MTRFWADFAAGYIFVAAAWILSLFLALMNKNMKNATKQLKGHSAEDEAFMAMAIRLSEENVANGGGPFGAVIVRDGEVVSTGANRVVPNSDPTAHAEVMAIRSACAQLGTFNLSGCTIYTSCEPCPMCLSAIYWAGIDHIFYANTKDDAKAIDFDDSFIYDQIPLAPSDRSIKADQLMRADALKVFHMWADKDDKVKY